ncbi:MAG: DinB family protein [Acidobacteriota bacterium]|nr:DinB family protein [Acidobacteriota bacterium]
MHKKLGKRGVNLLISIAAIATMALTGPIARAQEMTAADKDRAMQYLESTKKNIVDATKGLSKAQWNFKAGPDRWSVAEVMEHIAAAEDFIRQMIVEKAMKAPAEPGRDLKKTDDAVVAMIPDRSHKAQAPEPLKPSNRFGSPEGSVKHFLESRAETEKFLESTPDLRQHVSDSPLGMKLDAYEWLLFLTAHSERHLKQIEEVKTNADFPKA